MTSFNLEQPARELSEAIAKGPPLSGVSLADARKAAEAAPLAPTSLAVAALLRAFGTE
jgi:hypothetical protein